MNDKNILVITPSEKLNGTTKTFIAWFKELHKQGHKLYLYSSLGGSLPSLSRQLCEGQMFFQLGRLEPSIYRIFYIMYYIKKYNIDYVWGVGTTSSLAGSLASLCLKKHYLSILNVSRSVVWPKNPNWKYPISGNIITISNHFRKILINDSDIPKSSCHFVPFRFDLDEFKFKKQTNRDGVKKVISLIRRFDKQRVLGVISILKFIGNNFNIFSNYEINLYGDGDSIETIKHKIEELKNYNIDVNLKLFSNNINEIIASTDIVIGSERVAIESILVGRPILIIDDNGPISFVSYANLKMYINDNFSGLQNRKKLKCNEDDLINYFKNYKRLLNHSMVEKCNEHVKNIYKSSKGAEELISITSSCDLKKNRYRKILRIINSILHMYFSITLNWLNRKSF